MGVEIDRRSAVPSRRRSMSRMLRAGVAAASLAVCALGTASPASAVLPPVKCAEFYPFKYCLAFDGVNVWGSVQNVSGVLQQYGSKHLYLAYAADGAVFPTILNNGQAYISEITPGYIVKTWQVATWNPGNYCAVKEGSTAPLDRVCAHT